MIDLFNLGIITFIPLCFFFLFTKEFNSKIENIKVLNKTPHSFFVMGYLVLISFCVQLFTNEAWFFILFYLIVFITFMFFSVSFIFLLLSMYIKNSKIKMLLFGLNLLLIFLYYPKIQLYINSFIDNTTLRSIDSVNKVKYILKNKEYYIDKRVNKDEVINIINSIKIKPKIEINLITIFLPEDEKYSPLFKTFIDDSNEKNTDILGYTNRKSNKIIIQNYYKSDFTLIHETTHQIDMNLEDNDNEKFLIDRKNIINYFKPKLSISDLDKEKTEYYLSDKEIIARLSEVYYYFTQVKKEGILENGIYFNYTKWSEQDIKYCIDFYNKYFYNDII